MQECTGIERWIATAAMPPRNDEAGLNIQISNIQGILFDKSPAGFDNIAHEAGEDLVGGDGVIDGDYFRISFLT